MSVTRRSFLGLFPAWLVARKIEPLAVAEPIAELPELPGTVARITMVFSGCGYVTPLAVNPGIGPQLYWVWDNKGYLIGVAERISNTELKLQPGCQPFPYIEYDSIEEVPFPATIDLTLSTPDNKAFWKDFL